MAEKCDFLNKCGFFKHFNKQVEVLEKAWVIMYCESIERSEQCERKRIRKETGFPPADNLAPTGEMI